MSTDRPASPRRITMHALRWVLSAVVAGLFLLPLAWAAAASLRETGQPWPRTIDWLPSPIAWENYRTVFDVIDARRFALNSLLIVAVATPLTIFFASMAGFAIAQIGRRWRMRFLALSLICLMVPLTAVWLPRFLLFKEAGLIDHRAVLVVPALMGTSPLYVLIFVWAFSRVPRDHYEAARLDGAGPFRLWAEIGMPLARPAIVAVAVLASVHFWNSFIEPLLYIRTVDKMVASQGLRMLYQLDPANWSLIMTGAVLVSAPVLVMFVLMQRTFLQDRRGHSILGR
jgi:multiple sugar transport system permease protein